MASQAIEDQQVGRTVVEDLIGDIGVTNRGVLGLRNLVPCHHEPSLLPTVRSRRHPDAHRRLQDALEPRDLPQT
jgi:hypothetical protein